MTVRSVLLVCTGNLCRSPMAEHLLRAQLPGLEVASAGLAALVGQPMPAESLQALQTLGLDARAHRARQLSAWMVAHASLVLTAELRHKQHIERLYPQARGRVFRIDEAGHADLADPYQRSAEHHLASLHAIARALTPWTERIRRLGYASPLAA